MQHNEEKIKEIFNENEYRKILGGFCWFSDGGNGGYDFEDVKKETIKMIKAYGEHMYQKAIEDCIGSVPEKERANFGRETSWEMEHANGFNSCRERTLTNLKALQSK